jgi:hypothetical protein
MFLHLKILPSWGKIFRSCFDQGSVLTYLKLHTKTAENSIVHGKDTRQGPYKMLFKRCNL